VVSEITLLFHLIGFGILLTVSLAGMILNSRYRKAPDLATKLVILRALRPIGLLSPIGMVVMLITGIGNMHSIGAGVLEYGWLTGKIFLFAIAVISGILFGITSRKRTQLIESMARNEGPAGAEALVKSYDAQIGLFYVVLPLLLLVILALSVYGRFGG
jgi:hypothetical protein